MASVWPRGISKLLFPGPSDSLSRFPKSKRPIQGSDWPSYPFVVVVVILDLFYFMSCTLHRMKYVNFECVAHTTISVSVSVPISTPDYERAALERAAHLGSSAVNGRIGSCNDTTVQT